jgi:hypothetical protein
MPPALGYGAESANKNISAAGLFGNGKAAVKSGRSSVVTSGFTTG